MAAKVDRRRCPSKRKLLSKGEEILKTCNLRKKRKLQEKDDSSLRSESTIVEVSRGVEVLGSILHLLEVEHRF